LKTRGNLFFFISCGTILALLGGFVGVFNPAGAASEAKKMNLDTWQEERPFAQRSSLDNTDASSLEPNCRPNQISYWKLDETGPPNYVDSQDGRDATCTGAECPEPYAAGKYDGAQDFDGLDDRLATANSYNPTTGITAMAWIKPDTLVGLDKGIFYKDGVVYLELESDFNFSVDFSVIVNGRLLEYESQDSRVPIDQWTHIAGTYDGRELKVYMNGVRIPGSVIRVGSIDNKNKPYYIGYSFKETENRYFDGKIDEVAIFNKALSELEIARIYVNCTFRSMMPLVIEAPP